MSLATISKDIFLELVKYLTYVDVSNLRRTCRSLKDFSNYVGVRDCIVDVCTDGTSFCAYSDLEKDLSRYKRIKDLTEEQVEKALRKHIPVFVVKPLTKRVSSSKLIRKLNLTPARPVVDRIQKVYFCLKYDRLFHWIALCVKVVWKEFCRKYATSLPYVQSLHLRTMKRSHSWFSYLDKLGCKQILNDLPNCNLQHGSFLLSQCDILN